MGRQPLRQRSCRSCRLGATILGIAISVAVLASCEPPFEPGSDLPDSSPPAFPSDAAMDSDLDTNVVEGTDVSGRFEVRATLSSPVSDPVDVEFLGLYDQEGTIPEGMATVEVELRDPDQPGTEGASTEEPADISEEGTFVAVVSGLTIPASFSDQLAEDTDADVELDTSIIDENCMTGTLTVTLMDVVLEDGTTVPEVDLDGPFDAVRQGESCQGAGGGDTGVDADGGVVDGGPSDADAGEPELDSDTDVDATDTQQADAPSDTETADSEDGSGEVSP